MRAKEVADEVVVEDQHRYITERSRLDMMRGYGEQSACRREYMLNYFGEAYVAPCGNCVNCQRGTGGLPQMVEAPFAPGSRVAHAAFGEGEVERYDGDSMTVVFDEVGYKTLLTDFVISSKALQPLTES